MFHFKKQDTFLPRYLSELDKIYMPLPEVDYWHEWQAGRRSLSILLLLGASEAELSAYVERSRIYIEAELLWR